MNVLLPQPIEPEALAMLEKAGCQVITAENPRPETVLPLLRQAEGIILRTGITLTRELIAAAENLKVISRTGGGVDNVDVEAATEHGVVVTSNLGVNTVSVAEHVLSMMLSLSKQLPLMDNSVRNGNFKIRYKNLPCDLEGKTLGLLGFGRIGSRLGEICRQAFNMSVIAHDPYLAEDQKDRYVDQVKFVEMEALFSQADVLSIHVPLTEQTRHIVSADQINLMKSGALLINTSRGGVVDEEALATALRQNVIGGAGLDVFSQEPLLDESPLMKLGNVILTPHTAALTRECVLRMATEAVRCMLDVLTGKKPENVANPQTLSTGRWVKNRTGKSI